MTMKIHILATLVSIVFASDALAQGCGSAEQTAASERAGAAYDGKRYAEAMREYLALGQCGNIEAQHRLGDMYYAALGTPQRLDDARTWYLKAAGQGHAESQHNLGIIYGSGIGVQQDPVVARAWHRKAAEQGFSRSQNALGEMLYHGVGGLRDDKEAIFWFTKAANQGHVQAQANLAIFYDGGIGVERDRAKAIQWWFKAASQDYAPAQYQMARAHHDLYGVLNSHGDLVKSYAWTKLTERNACKANGSPAKTWAALTPTEQSIEMACQRAIELRNGMMSGLTTADNVASEKMIKDWRAGSTSMAPPSDDDFRKMAAALDPLSRGLPRPGSGTIGGGPPTSPSKLSRPSNPLR